MVKADDQIFIKYLHPQKRITIDIPREKILGWVVRMIRFSSKVWLFTSKLAYYHRNDNRALHFPLCNTFRDCILKASAGTPTVALPGKEGSGLCYTRPGDSEP